MKERERFTVAIDRGNSYVKATLLEGSRPVGRIRSQRCDSDALRDLCDVRDISAVVVACVGSESSGWRDMLNPLHGIPVLEVDHDTPLPIRIDYVTMDTLGLDRIAAAVGAAALFPGQACLVADAGTALTLDMVDACGCFRGGDISPGIKLRLRGLHEYTDRLPEIEKQGDVPCFGYDTATAMRSGAVRGAAAEVMGAFLRARRLYGTSLIVLTGGDSTLIEPYVREYLDSGVRLVSEGDLVAIGLYHILLHNKQVTTCPER